MSFSCKQVIIDFRTYDHEEFSNFEPSGVGILEIHLLEHLKRGAAVSGNHEEFPSRFEQSYSKTI